MKPAEREAFTLHAQRVPVETIEEQTGLTRPQVAAAVDLGRLHAQAALQAEAAPRQPAAPRQLVRVRRAVVPQLPGAAIPPSPSLPSFTQLPSFTDAPRKNQPAADPVKQTPVEAAPAAASQRALDRLAHSSKVRAWAAADGWVVPAPGRRLPGGIVLAYLKANGGNP